MRTNQENREDLIEKLKISLKKLERTEAVNSNSGDEVNMDVEIWLYREVIIPAIERALVTGELLNY